MREFEDPGDQLLGIPLDPKSHVMRRPTGPKDPKIMCHECEARFQRYDQCGVETLRLVPVPHPRWGTDPVCELPGADAGRLKLFFMHVLWRAHEASMPDLMHVDIGARAERLRELLLADDPGGEDDFAVLLLRYEPDPEGTHRFISPPTLWEWHWRASKHYAFHLGQWVARVTFSKVGIPPGLRRVALVPGSPVPVTTADRAFRDGPEFQAVLETLRRRVANDEP